MNITVSISQEDIEAIASRVVELMAQSEPSLKELYSPEDLAQRYGLSRETILQRMREGVFGQLVGTGKKKMVTAAGLERYESQEHRGQPAAHKLPAVHRGNPGRI